MPNCENCHWQRSYELIKQMRALLENYEFVPFEMFTELKNSVNCQPFQAKFKELERYLDRTDYDNALIILSNITCAAGHDFSFTSER
jgi:hypothetical protein